MPSRGCVTPAATFLFEFSIIGDLQKLVTIHKVWGLIIAALSGKKSHVIHLSHGDSF